MGVRRMRRMGLVVGKHQLDKGGKGGYRSVQKRFRKKKVSWKGTGHVWEERICS